MFDGSSFAFYNSYIRLSSSRSMSDRQDSQWCRALCVEYRDVIDVSTPKTGGMTKRMNPGASGMSRRWQLHCQVTPTSWPISIFYNDPSALEVSSLPYRRLASFFIRLLRKYTFGFAIRKQNE